MIKVGEPFSMDMGSGWSYDSILCAE